MVPREPDLLDVVPALIVEERRLELCPPLVDGDGVSDVESWWDGDALEATTHSRNLEIADRVHGVEESQKAYDHMFPAESIAELLHKFFRFVIPICAPFLVLCVCVPRKVYHFFVTPGQETNGLHHLC